MFYTYNQNNSFGRFDYDYEEGISHLVIVEARNYTEANQIAEGIGLYFGGWGDCHCCGDRWHSQYENDGTRRPQVYDTPVALMGTTNDIWDRKWIHDGWEGFIHYKDGPKVGFWGPDGPGLEVMPKVIKGQVINVNRQSITP